MLACNKADKVSRPLNLSSAAGLRPWCHPRLTGGLLGGVASGGAQFVLYMLLEFS